MKSPIHLADASDRETIQFIRSPSGLRLEACQLLPQPRQRLFEFFSDAFRLETITPPWLHFSVLTPAPIVLAAGTLIDYRLRVHGIPMRWQSRIDVWEPPLRFVDEQVRGPYRHWRHEHLFEEVPGGTLCRDVVEYAVPGGRLIDKLFVRRDLRKIFLFRQRALAEAFASGVLDASQPDVQPQAGAGPDARSNPADRRESR